MSALPDSSGGPVAAGLPASAPGLALVRPAVVEHVPARRGFPLPAFLRRWLGRGEAACTVPPFDGVLKPNQALEAAPVVAEFDAPNDLAGDGTRLWVADGTTLWTLDPASGARREAARFDQPITALAWHAGRLALALGGTRVIERRVEPDGRVATDDTGQGWDAADGRRFVSVNALAYGADGRLHATEGSATYDTDRWCHDLMTLGRGGRLLRLDDGGRAAVLKDRLAHAYGVCPMPDGRLWLAESWQHRVVALGSEGRRETALVDRLPGYPSRLAPAAGGGAWLTVFTCRTQLVELVLREPEYRRRMVAEIDPRYWVAPALAAGQSFLEPLQGGGVKTMGVLKPWAPPRSYGLVIRLGSDGRPRFAYHSRVGGRRHGIVAAAELGGALYVLSKGSGAVLRLPLEGIEA